MRFTVSITLLAAAAAVDAAAVQEAKRWCSNRGQACDTVKRVADAFAAALESASSVTAREENGSQAAFMAKRQVDELARSIAASHNDPRGYYSALKLAHNHAAEASPEKRAAEADAEADAQGWCTGFPGQPCWKLKREAEAEAQWCTGFPGQPCWKKRTAGPEAQWCTGFPGQPCWKEKREAGAEADAEADPQWCTGFPGFPGQPCWKKRDADAEHQWCLRFPGQPCWKRDANPEAEPEADPQWCLGFPGQPCWKREATPGAAEDQKRCVAEGGSCWIAKRAAEAVVQTIEAELAYRTKRSADPAMCLRYPGSPCWKRSAEADPQWCTGFPGQPCWKRDAAAAAAACNAPDGACTIAVRDLHAMHNAARAILDNN
ncbi:Clock-controlled pheromone ccg-4 [Madurella mycetomatis]|uniref:Clock-controlled pheromone ccg-4 n=1 Tax=Madurella mycetomatis TaxID=100816 RepID=A0A175WAL3_9PEZI|nr:Clock-controlled pheromone ccg-4 [Madurella mycetomatis]